MDRGDRRRRQATALVLLGLCFLGNLWPAAVPAARAEPLLFGLPFALGWMLITIIASFLVLLWLYRTEGDDGGE